MPNRSDVHSNVQNHPGGNRRYRYMNIDKVFDANVSSGDKAAAEASASQRDAQTTLNKTFKLLLFSHFLKAECLISDII